MSLFRVLLERAGPLLSECGSSFCSVNRCHLGFFVASPSTHEDVFPFKGVGDFPSELGAGSEENVFFKEMLNVLPGDETMSLGD